MRKTISRESFGKVCICRTRFISSEKILQKDGAVCGPETHLLKNRDMSMCPQRNLREGPGKRQQGALKYPDLVLAQAGITASVLNLGLDSKPSER